MKKEIQRIWVSREFVFTLKNEALKRNKNIIETSKEISNEFEKKNTEFPRKLKL
jgi:hypothetical protein